MSRKGVAVPYIIAIVLGVVVIGLIGYWLFISGGNLGTTSTTQKCKSDLLTFCNTYLVAPTSTWTQSDSCKSTGLYPDADTKAAIQSRCAIVGVTIQ